MEVIRKIRGKLDGKKVVAYGADVTCLAFLSEAERNDIDIAYVVDGNEQKQGMKIFGKDIRNPYDLMLEDKDNIVVVICAPSGGYVIHQNLIEMGFTDGTNIISNVVEDRNTCDHVDALLGLSRGKNTIVSMDEDDGKTNPKKILVLGGSTSDPYFDGIHSWPYYLQKEINRNEKNARVFSGGVIAYATAQNLLLLLREGIYMKPDLVIDYSGYNDYIVPLDIMDGGRYPLVGRNLYDWDERMIESYKKEKEIPPMYYGIKTFDNLDLYVHNIRSIHGICREFDIDFVSFFQPVLSCEKIEHGSIAERLMDEDIVKDSLRRFDEFYGDFSKIINDISYVEDFTQIFKDESDVFIDTCHVNEKGNEIIAQNIYRKLMERGMLNNL